MNFKNLALLFALLFAGNTAFAADVSLSTDSHKISYAIGMQIGKDLSRSGIDLNVDAMTVGIRDMVENQPPKLSQAETEAALALLREQQMKKQMAVGDNNKAVGVAFLEKNKTQEGVVALPSGLQYKVLTKGTGASPTLSNSVVAHYEGSLIDGTIFDSSIKRGEPATFQVTGVIKGWTEILQKMKIGSKWRVYIPSELAYGERGSGQLIGPNTTLIFDIELIEIK